MSFDLISRAIEYVKQIYPDQVFENWIRTTVLTDKRLSEDVKNHILFLWQSYMWALKLNRIIGWKVMTPLDVEKVEYPFKQVSFPKYTPRAHRWEFKINLVLDGVRLAVYECWKWNKIWSIDDAVEVFKSEVADHIRRQPTHAQKRFWIRVYGRHRIWVPVYKPFIPPTTPTG